jgi:hypothetical protein
MATFRKFAFPNQATADKLLASLQPLDTAVPLGELDGFVCYDILFHITYLHKFLLILLLIACG